MEKLKFRVYICVCVCVCRGGFVCVRAQVERAGETQISVER